MSLGRAELVTLLLERGADPIEAAAEPWATPLIVGGNMNRGAVRSILLKHAPHRPNSPTCRDGRE